MEYRATLDKAAKFITVFCFILLAGIAGMNFFVGKIPFWIGILFALISLATLAGGFFYAPSKYLIENGAFIIVRPSGMIKIPLQDIADARLVSSKELGTLIRLWGSGGLFGFYGYFRSTRMGRMKLYTTRLNNRILITTVDDNRLLISPDDTSIINHLKA